MILRQFITASLAVILFSSTAINLKAQALKSLGKVQPEVKLSKNIVPASDSVAVAVNLNISEGWHVNAYQPTLDYLIGTDLNIESHQGFTISNFQYPESKRFTFAFAQEPLDVYEGQASIFFTLQTSENLTPGAYSLPGSLRIQACNDNSCLGPSTLDITIPVEVAAAHTAFKPVNGNLFSAYEDESGKAGSTLESADANSIASMFNERGMILAFLGIFLIGLSLNLTPCVYPMLSVTVSLLGGQAGQKTNTRHSFMIASIYVLGIVSTYSILGVAAAYTGSLFGNWLQSSSVLAGVGIILLAMALSMFGLFELQPPLWILQKLGGTKDAVGPAGHFLSGVMVGIFAAPCIGPPVIALLTFVGTQGDPVFGFTTFFAMALGLGLPYLFLGTFSSLLNRLPKSGEWMVWVKKLFGVVLVGAALFFLALAWTPKNVLYTLPTVFILGGIYLGFIESSGKKLKTFPWFKRLMGVASILGGILIVMNLVKSTVEWEPYTPEKLQQAARSETLVVLDFYADWCVPCLELDRITFTDPRVITALQDYRTIKVDLTDYQSLESEALRKQFGVVGVPTLIFLDERGKEIRSSRIVGFVDVEEFLRKMPE